MVVAAWAFTAQGATKVGNGDDGADLEAGTPVTEGPLLEAREQAVKHLESLNVRGIPGLGSLVAETQGAKLVMAKEDAEARVQEDEGPFHVNFKGKVYARTFPEPHAATRFFPAALEVRQGAARRSSHSRSAPPRAPRFRPGGRSGRRANYFGHHLRRCEPRSGAAYGRRVSCRRRWYRRAGPLTRPSWITSRRRLRLATATRCISAGNTVSQFPIQAMHTVVSELYPFGGMNAPFGLGIEGSLVHDSKGSHMGPLGFVGASPSLDGPRFRASASGRTRASTRFPPTS